MAIQHVQKLLESAYSRLEELQQLGPNWDGEDALPIDEKVIAHARELLEQASGRALETGTTWLDPGISPAPDGAVELSWERGDRWVMLTVQPGRGMLACVIQDQQSEPKYQVESPGDAVERALWAMRGGN